MKINLKKIGIEQERIVQKIMEEAPFFFLMTEGASCPSDQAIQDLTALPPGINNDQKYFFLFINQHDQAIGVCDLILGHPNKHTAFIGLLLLSERFQGKSYGRQCYQLIETFSLEQGMTRIELGFVENNPVEEFWKKLGFSRNGRSRAHIGLNIQSTVHVMEKCINLETPNN